ncbi:MULTISPECIES: phage protein NinX family protein [Pantoea]|jgi:hypothetical protein|uniref:phage protein NinX family protein n=1 Tax=Pantoea TaxID=53335 RepID=UPI0006615348|nr:MULTISPECIES: phage protein NinX family protein [Pantoea]MDU2730484.1 phage protein NinX family protein [Pantoea sp.]MDU6091937.1 phage protein NinX family protein [Staphylococcus lugdunensis]DAW17435.1 MAG TPA: Protein of unknown function (DUF2591) [Caudoviricetes sp.]
MNYSEMSDFEINAAVAAIIHPGMKITNFAGEAVVWFGNLETRVVRYCNSWADAGPIIQNNLISLDSVYDFTDETEGFIEPTGMWNCVGISKGEDFCRAEHENPLRAAMIVFLMMLETE